MSPDRRDAINALKYIFDFADRERDISAKQAKEADDRKDFRQGDRDISYSLAMQKVRAKCLHYARECYLYDLTEDAATLSEPNEAKP